MSWQRVLVTGGSGFLGRHVRARLSNQGREVFSCSRREGVDLRDPQAFAEYLRRVRPDCVVHCAAHVGGIAYVQHHAVAVFEDNLKIAMGLLGGLHAAGGPPLVNIMPNCVYPGDHTVYREPHWQDGPVHDSVLMYGLPRRTLWGLAVTYGRQHGIRCGHLILPNLYGPHDHFEPEKSHALGALVAKVVQARRAGAPTVAIWGSGKPVREWLYVDDAAAAIAGYLKLMEAGPDKMEACGEDSAGAVWNVGIGQGISIGDLALTICRAAGYGGRLVFDPARPDGALQKLLDGTRFTAATGWRPQVPLGDGIAQTVAWFEAATSEIGPNEH